MAGGQSVRFWPVARKNFPKHFLSMDGQNSFVKTTVQRAEKLTSKDKIYVVGGVNYTDLINEHIPFVKYIPEPLACNTAPALGLSALHVLKDNPDSVMIALPADHTVQDEIKFKKTILDAVTIASEFEVLVTVGILPTFPHTDYGYIRRGERIGEECCECPAYTVSRFFEKPNLKRARVYFASEEFYWNSGMFVWRPQVLMSAIKEHMPELYDGLMKIKPFLDTPKELKALEELYHNIEPISIDFGVMEHAKNCVVIDADSFGWDDVGGWDAWAEHFKQDEDGNTALGDVMFLDSSDCIVNSNKNFTAVVGVDDLVVINTSDALLVCTRDRLGDIKKVTSELEKNGRKELL